LITHHCKNLGTLGPSHIGIGGAVNPLKHAALPTCITPHSVALGHTVFGVGKRP